MLIDAHILDVHVHGLPLPSCGVEVVPCCQASSGMAQEEPAIDQRIVQGEEHWHLRDHYGPQLPVEVQDQLLPCDPELELTSMVERHALRIPVKAVLEVLIRGIFREDSLATRAEAPRASRRRTSRWAISPLLGVNLPEPNELVGGVHRLNIREGLAPFPGVLRRHRLEEIHLWWPVLTAEKGVVLLQQGLARRRRDDSVTANEPGCRPCAPAFRCLEADVDPAILEAALLTHRDLRCLPSPVHHRRVVVGVLTVSLPALHELRMRLIVHARLHAQSPAWDELNHVGIVAARDIDLAKAARDSIHSQRDIFENEELFRALRVFELI
mmetsp:Transcript_56/g.191  ORF Transcript_56/g.191 Transcript_56/m.191 type:complete len:326 (+) Transcript_56:851-1828(+)